jgi:peptide/nickel transport system substrate-binding protein
MSRSTALTSGGLALIALLGTGSSLSYYEESLPTTLNPLFAASMVDNRSLELVFDRLWFHDPITNDLKSRVVEKYELVDQGKGLKITLRSGIKWHNDKPLTAKDLCFTVDAMLDPKTPSPIAEGYREVLAGCEAQGNQVAVVRFTRVFHNPRERLGFAILPQGSFASTAIAPDLEFSSQPVGTGPFKGSRGRRGATFDAVANAHHNPTVAQLRLNEGADPIVQVKTLINNGVQGIIAVPPPNRPELSSSDEVSLKSYDLRSWWFIAVNTKSGPMADPKVRQALNLLIDRERLRELAIGVKPGEQNSPCELISGPFVQSSPYYNRAIPVVAKADKAKADALLKAAGLTQEGGSWMYKGTKVTLRIGLLAPLDFEAPDLLDQIGNQLGAAGFDRRTAKISSDEWTQKVVTGRAAAEYDLVIGKWSFGLVEDVNDLFHTRAASEGKFNIFGYSNAQVDQILTEYEGSRTDTSAQNAYHKLHEVLAQDLPYLFLWKLDTRSAWRTEVRGNIIAPYYYFTEVDAWKYGK